MNPTLPTKAESVPAYLSAARLNDINAHLDFARFVHRNGAIFGLVDVAALPFVADHVARAFRQLCAVADGIDDLLQAEFGGQTAFLEPVTSTYRH